MATIPVKEWLNRIEQKTGLKMKIEVEGDSGFFYFYAESGRAKRVLEKYYSVTVILHHYSKFDIEVFIDGIQQINTNQRIVH